MLTLEFYPYKLDGFTVLCMEPDIRLGKNLKAWFSPSIILYRSLRYLPWFRADSSQPLKTAGFSRLNCINREESLVEIISCGTGYEINLFGMLYLRPLENGEFAVGDDDSCKPEGKRWEKFKDPRR